MKLYNSLKSDLKTVIDGNEIIFPAGAKVEVCDGFVDRIRKIYPFIEVVASKKIAIGGKAKAVAKSLGNKPKTKKNE